MTRRAPARGSQLTSGRRDQPVRSAPTQVTFLNSGEVVNYVGLGSLTIATKNSQTFTGHDGAGNEHDALRDHRRHHVPGRREWVVRPVRSSHPRETWSSMAPWGRSRACRCKEHFIPPVDDHHRRAQSYTGTLTLAQNTVLNGTSVTISGTLDGAYTLIVNGAATFDGTVGGSTPLSSLTVNGSVTLGGPGLPVSITTVNALAFTGVATLGAATSLTSIGGGISFTNGAVDGDFPLTLSASSGAVTLDDPLGSNVPLGGLAVTSAIGIVAGDDITTANGNVTFAAGDTDRVGDDRHGDGQRHVWKHDRRPVRPGGGLRWGNDVRRRRGRDDAAAVARDRCGGDDGDRPGDDGWHVDVQQSGVPQRTDQSRDADGRARGDLGLLGCAGHRDHVQQHDRHASAALPEGLIVESNRAQDLQRSDRAQYPLAYVITELVSGTPSPTVVTTEINSPSVTTVAVSGMTTGLAGVGTGDQDYDDTTSISAQTVLNVGGSLVFASPASAPAGNTTASVTVVGGPTTSTINLSQVTVPVTLEIMIPAGTTQAQPATLIGGQNTNTFIQTATEPVALTLIGGGPGSTNTFNIAPTISDTIVSGGGQNTINLGTTPTGATVDLNQVNGQTQYIYRPALTNTENFSGSQLASLSSASLSLQGSFSEAIGSNDDTFFAAGIRGCEREHDNPFDDPPDGNRQYGVRRTRGDSPAFGGGNTVMPSPDGSAASAINAFLPKASAGTEGYRALPPASQQAYLIQNVAEIGGYIARGSTSLPSFLNTNAAGIGGISAESDVGGWILAAEPGRGGRLHRHRSRLADRVLGDGRCRHRRLHRHQSGGAGRVPGNAAAAASVTGFLVNDPASSGSFRLLNSAAIAAYQAVNPTATVLFSTFMDTSPSSLGSYLRQPQNSASLTGYLAENSASTGGFLADNPSYLGGYLRSAGGGVGCVVHPEIAVGDAGVRRVELGGLPGVCGGHGRQQPKQSSELHAVAAGGAGFVPQESGERDVGGRVHGRKRELRRRRSSREVRLI